MRLRSTSKLHICRVLRGKLECDTSNRCPCPAIDTACAGSPPLACRTVRSVLPDTDSPVRCRSRTKTEAKDIPRPPDRDTEVKSLERRLDDNGFGNSTAAMSGAVPVPQEDAAQAEVFEAVPGADVVLDEGKVEHLRPWTANQHLANDPRNYRLLPR